MNPEQVLGNRTVWRVLSVGSGLTPLGFERSPGEAPQCLCGAPQGRVWSRCAWTHPGTVQRRASRDLWAAPGGSTASAGPPWNLSRARPSSGERIGFQVVTTMIGPEFWGFQETTAPTLWMLVLTCDPGGGQRGELRPRWEDMESQTRC